MEFVMIFRTEVAATMAKQWGFQNSLNASKTEKSVNSWPSPWLLYPFDICIFYFYCNHPLYKSRQNYFEWQFNLAILYELLSGIIWQ